MIETKDVCACQHDIGGKAPRIIYKRPLEDRVVGGGNVVNRDRSVGKDFYSSAVEFEFIGPRNNHCLGGT